MDSPLSAVRRRPDDNLPVVAFVLRLRRPSPLLPSLSASAVLSGSTVALFFWLSPSLPEPQTVADHMVVDSGREAKQNDEASLPRNFLAVSRVSWCGGGGCCSSQHAVAHTRRADRAWPVAVRHGVDGQCFSGASQAATRRGSRREQRQQLEERKEEERKQQRQWTDSLEHGQQQGGAARGSRRGAGVAVQRAERGMCQGVLAGGQRSESPRRGNSRVSCRCLRRSSPLVLLLTLPYVCVFSLPTRVCASRPARWRGMAWIGRGVDAGWTRSGRGVDAEWTRGGRGVDAEWTRSGRGVDAEWTRSGRGTRNSLEQKAWRRSGRAAKGTWYVPVGACGGTV
ncbi:unnamed protein product [Closterium sp. NIES-64]|nr:unnamed protein product [Closterium sp. NIES-64]